MAEHSKNYFKVLIFLRFAIAALTAVGQVGAVDFNWPPSDTEKFAPAAAPGEGDKLEVVSVRVTTEEIVHGADQNVLRIQLKFPEVHELRLDDSLRDRLQDLLKARTDEDGAILSICGLSPFQTKKFHRILEDAGIHFDDVLYDPALYDRTVVSHSKSISLVQGFLALYGWSQIDHAIGFWNGASFVLFNFATAKILTDAYPKLLKNLRQATAKRFKAPNKAIAAELLTWFVIQFGINWTAREILTAGPTGEGAPTKVFRLLKDGHLDPAFIMEGNFQILIMALLSIYNGTLISLREERILENAVSKHRLHSNYAAILKSYGNFARFYLFAWLFLLLQVGSHGPIDFQILAPDGTPIFELTRVHEIILGGSTAMLIASFMNPGKYFSGIQTVFESSRSLRSGIASRLKGCANYIKLFQKRRSGDNE